MAAYKTIRSFYEDDIGTIQDVLIYSDVYADLEDLDGATTVSVFTLDSTKESLDSRNSVYVNNEMQFGIDESLAESADDLAAIAFVLSARDRITKIFCARLITPGSPVDPSDFAFRGEVRPDVSADDVRWKQGEYTDDRTPVRRWNCTATVFDVSTLLSQSLKDMLFPVDELTGEELPFAIDSTWIAANVSDRLGYFKEDSARFGLREARFSQLVALETLLQKILDLSESNGVTMTYIPTDTDLYIYPAYYIPVETPSNVLRYCDNFPASYTIAPKPWRIITSQTYRLRTGGTGADAGSPYVSFRLVNPAKSAERFSWLRYKVAELLYAIAYGFSMYLDIRYVTSTDVEIKFLPRQDLGVTECFFRNGTKGQLKLAPIDPQGEKPVVGVANDYVVEGPEYYLYDDIIWSHDQGKPPEIDAEFLPLTIAPSWCFLQSKGEDAAYDLVDRQGRALIPHNCTFYDRGTIKSEQVEYNTAGLHTAIYTNTTGLARSASMREYGVEGLETWRPVAQAVALIDGKYQYFDRLADYTNIVYNRDAAYYEGEYRITVPGLMGFRATVGGVSSWKNIRPGYKLTFDGVEYIVTAVDRKLIETEITIHHIDQVAGFATPSAASGGVDPESNSPPPSGNDTIKATQRRRANVTPGMDIRAFQVLAISADGLALETFSSATEYGKSYMLALEAYDSEADSETKVVRCATAGIVDLGDYADTLGLTPNARLFLRTGYPNWGQVALTAKTSTENFYLEIGHVADDGRGIVLDFKKPGFVYE